MKAAQKKKKKKPGGEGKTEKPVRRDRPGEKKTPNQEEKQILDVGKKNTWQGQVEKQNPGNCFKKKKKHARSLATQGNYLDWKTHAQPGGRENRGTKRKEAVVGMGETKPRQQG